MRKRRRQDRVDQHDPDLGRQSLLKNANLSVRVLILTIGTPSAVLGAVADTLSVVTTPIDQLLYNLLGLLGIGVGQADIQVTDARCMQPVLVQ